jgi:hypothetical protein
MIMSMPVQSTASAARREDPVMEETVADSPEQNYPDAEYITAGGVPTDR